MNAAQALGGGNGNSGAVQWGTAVRCNGNSGAQCGEAATVDAGFASSSLASGSERATWRSISSAIVGSTTLPATLYSHSPYKVKGDFAIMGSTVSAQFVEIERTSFHSVVVVVLVKPSRYGLPCCSPPPLRRAATALSTCASAHSVHMSVQLYLVRMSPAAAPLCNRRGGREQ